MLQDCTRQGQRTSIFALEPWQDWLLNAVFQAVLMFLVVMYATQAIYADRSSGTTFSHWEVPTASHMDIF